MRQEEINKNIIIILISSTFGLGWLSAYLLLVIIGDLRHLEIIYSVGGFISIMFAVIWWYYSFMRNE